MSLSEITIDLAHISNVSLCTYQMLRANKLTLETQSPVVRVQDLQHGCRRIDGWAEPAGLGSAAVDIQSPQ